jgi:hypothetical protein
MFQNIHPRKEQATTEKSNSEAEDGEGHFNKHSYQGLVIEEAQQQKKK